MVLFEIDFYQNYYINMLSLFIEFQHALFFSQSHMFIIIKCLFIIYTLASGLRSQNRP